jgi:hypothetical protein
MNDATNPVIGCNWQVDGGRLMAFSAENLLTGQTLNPREGGLPRVVLDDGRAVDVASAPVRREAGALVATVSDEQSGLNMRWSATLDGGANAIIQSLQLTATCDVVIADLVFFDASLAEARQVGQVDGSVVVCGDLFLAVEHPLARNTADDGGRGRCRLPRGNVLKVGQSWTYTSACGAVPPGQLRRGFLAYLEQGVVFFKFDGMGAGNVVAGAEAESAGDIDAILQLTPRPVPGPVPIGCFTPTRSGGRAAIPVTTGLGIRASSGSPTATSSVMNVSCSRVPCIRSTP